MRNKLGLRLAVIGLLVSLIVSVGLTVMPQKAYADGETYVFTTSFQNGTVVNIIQGTGGSYKGTAEFFCFQSCGTPGQTNTWRNAVFLLNPPNTAGPSGCGAAGSTVSIRFLNFGSDGKWP